MLMVDVKSYERDFKLDENTFLSLKSIDPETKPEGIDWYIVLSCRT